MARISLIVLACMVLLMIGCGQSAEEKAIETQIEKETGTDASVDVSEKGVKLSGKTEEGEFTVTTGDEAEIPKDFPGDIFIYRPSKISMAMNLPEGYSVALTTKDDKSTVMGAYKREMTGQGWAEGATMDMGTSSMLVYEKGDRSASIAIASSEKELQVNVTASK